ncbi:helix-turn-helix domain-containing protein [Kitasatospora viridis]|uniref:AraC-like ligand-binding domain-containing protein n=1 Tax=Kitasatospora viridis TaxID=281105 RepID=UPI001478E2F2|nr:helix-turn-helix domain-containing protein [Kitasatospora viridis]
MLCTEGASAETSFRLWGELVASACGPLRVHRSGQGTFEGAIVTGTFGAVQLASVRAEPHTVELPRPAVAGPAADGPLCLSCVLDGEVTVSQGGRTVVAQPGNLFSYDSSYPFSLRMSRPIHMATVKFDHRLVDLRAGLAHPLWAASWSGREGVSALLANLLRSTACHLTELDGTVADLLGRSVASLVSAVCADKLGEAGGAPDGARRALLHRIRVYARAHLGDPGLTPARLAREHRISLRYLQLLFQEEGVSPALWIRNERLERCREDLADPRTAHLSVAEVAERWGLLGASHFSKLFRQRYGVPPREWRRNCLRVPS